MAKFIQYDDEYTDEDKYGVQGVIDEIEEKPSEILEPFSEEEEDADLSDMSEVEIRLEEANCLKALLYNSLFEEPLSPIAKRVERRIRAFIHAELKTLLGINEAPVKLKATPPLFEADELTILKALARKAISKLAPGTVVSSPEPVAAPVIVEAPKAAPEPVVKRMAAPEGIKVRRAKAPKTKPKTPQQEPEQQALFPEERKEVTLPNGMVVSTTVQQQVRPPAHLQGFPTLSADQQASYYEQQALTNKPVSGMLGIMAAAVDKFNSTRGEDE